MLILNLKVGDQSPPVPTVVAPMTVLGYDMVIRISAARIFAVLQVWMLKGVDSWRG